MEVTPRYKLLTLLTLLTWLTLSSLVYTVDMVYTAYIVGKGHYIFYLIKFSRFASTDSKLSKRANFSHQYDSKLNFKCENYFISCYIVIVCNW